MIYNRASADKSGQRVSVESQDTENRAWCAREGWEVAAAVTDNDRSATRYATREREGYRRVREGIASGAWGPIDVLVMWESSRGERRLDGHVELRELCARRGVKLAYRGRVLNMDDGDDRFTAGLDALLDEREAERARKRTERSHAASVAAGKPRGVIPYGYRREYAPGSGHMLGQVPDPRTAPVVQGIVSDVLAGATLYSVAQKLNDAGVDPPRVEHRRRLGRAPDQSGFGWTSSIIRNLLGKQSLMGVRTHNGIPTGTGTWEAIVSPADWQAVQALLKEPGRVAHHGGRDPVWLCSGLVRCGVCGAWLRPMRRKGQMTYTCAGLTPTSSKGHVSRQAQYLDAFVTRHVIRNLADPRLLESIARRSDDATVQVDADRVKLADLQARMASYVASAKSATGIAAEAFAEAVNGLAVEIEQLQAALTLSAPLPAPVVDLAGPDAEQRWDSPRVQADINLRRLVVRTLLRVTVHRSLVAPGAHGFDASSVEVEDVRGHNGPQRT